MNSRFEHLIIGAVAAGALTLTGCASSGGGGGGGGGGGTPAPDETTVQFLGGRVVADNQVRLFFSDALEVPDSAVVAGKFVLHGTALTYGLDFSSHSFFTSVDDITAAAYRDKFKTSYDLASGDAVGSATAAVANTDAHTIDLTFPAAITTTEDSGTGVLRLTYSGGDDGIADADGNVLPELAVEEGHLGNIGTIGPAIAAARTISSKKVELTYTEPVKVNAGNTAAAVSHFEIAANWISGSHSVLYTDNIGSASQPDVEFFIDSSFTGHPLSVSSLGSVSLTDLSVTTGEGTKVVLKLSGDIPASADCRGYLRLTYTLIGDESRITAADNGADAQELVLSATHRGNVNDEAGDNNASCWHQRPL